ncbi:uncharacterized protein J3R85_013788 [Psidium guajava]|nr:uncharacterized protein J3R85_013788 [Psidium guajava]
MSPSSVTRACDHVGITVVGHGFVFIGPDLVRLSTDPPAPSRELCHAVRAKARATWFLEWRVPRQAGLTEHVNLPLPAVEG